MNVVVAALRNAPLRRVEAAYAAFSGAEWAVWIAMLVYAYDRGGATTAGVVALAQLVPAAVVAPVAASRVRSLAAGYAAQAVAMGATAAVILAHGPPLLAYGGAAVAATAVTLTRPAQAALLPALARSPEELTAANVLSGWVESASVLVAPAAAGVLLAVSSPGAVFAVMAVLALAAAAAVLPLPHVPAAAEEERVVRSPLPRDPGVRLVLVVIAVEFVVLGALDVLYVVLAEAQLRRGGSWTGYLNAAFGAGGFVAVAVTSSLVGRRLALPLVAATAVWAATFGVLAAAPHEAAVFAFLAVGGVARAVVDVAARTLLQRTAPPELVGRLFGVVEGLSMAALAAGSLLVPALVALGGARTACAGIAAVLLAAAALAARGLARIDAAASVPVVELALLRSVPMLAPLDAPTLEALARGAATVSAAPGDVLIREGDRGDRYYVVADGTLDVTIRGAHVADLGRGDGFGELALLADVPRTATVTARTATRTLALERDSFLRAVTANDRSSAVGAQLLADRGVVPSR